MASPAVISFHNAQMEQERKRVALRIANGTKASSNLVIGHRMQHPSYKGLPDNSTGSRNQPFFAMKDESQCPLEDKIRMRGGVLSTDAGRQYAKSILKRRAEDTNNIERMKNELPPVPPKLLELDEEESKSLELNTIIDGIDDALNAGTAFGVPISEVSKLPRLLISLSPTFAEQQITALIDVFDDLYGRARQTQSIRRNNRAGDAEDAAETISVARLAIPLERCIDFLKEILKVVNLANENDKRIALLGIAKRSFKGDVKGREAERLLERPEEAPVEEQMPPLIPVEEAAAAAEEGAAATAAAPTAVRRRRVSPEEAAATEERARVGAAFDEWFESLDGDGKRNARVRLRNATGRQGGFANIVANATTDQLKLVARNSSFPSERREL